MLLFIHIVFATFILLVLHGNVIYFHFFLRRFDELHYGKYAGLYMQNTFFFDSQPPLGKQLIAIAAYIAGFDGEF